MLNLFEVFSENSTPPFLYMIYPPFSFYRWAIKTAKLLKGMNRWLATNGCSADYTSQLEQSNKILYDLVAIDKFTNYLRSGN